MKVDNEDKKIREESEVHQPISWVTPFLRRINKDTKVHL